ncbi:MAG TPA: transposase [Isosphaeraceae bacterium]|nr:transposase [Isosphaeraceae bacterium]
MLKIQAIIDDAKCYEVIRSLRWPDGVRCPHCDSGQVIKQGRDPTQPERRHYECRGCHRRFDDLTGTTLPTTINRCGSGSSACTSWA